MSSLYDFLCLLDGRLMSLAILVIHVERIFKMPVDIDCVKQLSKLKCLSLKSVNYTDCYDGLIVPLLCPMTNLAELKLSLSFTFRIDTKVISSKIIDELPSNEQIQCSFSGRGYQKVASSVYTTPLDLMFAHADYAEQLLVLNDLLIQTSAPQQVKEP
ncbi:hypothetical protein I4U23_029863 [Adineta vaga]|nr:hypothetical protein I4U23_029863 [Adineta vaga]